MAFIDIPDRAKAKEVVEEYIRMRNEVRVRNENNKETNLIKEHEKEERFKPIVAATEKSAEKITSAIRNDGSGTPYDYYSSLTRNRDKYFGIYRGDGGFRSGGSDIQIDEENNISILDKSYGYSQGLWDLIMLNNPNDGDYSNEDLEHYKEIVQITDLINNPRVINTKSRYKQTAKYKFLESLSGNKRMRLEGDGIILPGDINGLKERLQLVCGERAAGNIEATTPEIVAILDELLRRNYISRSEYNAVCKELGC